MFRCWSWFFLYYPPLAYIIQFMEFIETPTFSRLLSTLLDDDEYRELQNVLLEAGVADVSDEFAHEESP